ncbi:MAG: homoserine dehydrogenase [Anaerolineae bacterium]|jgi:homoserine dehydrogenase|nr:homoserine dehydrogenase [Anaerolineae bacterium]
MKLALIGLGNVGQGFLQILRDKSSELAVLQPQLVAVITRSRGTLWDPNGLDLELVYQFRQNLRLYPTTPTLQRDLDPLTLITTCNADVLIEASPSDFMTAQPALDYVYAALNSGLHAVLVNKGPIALDYHGLKHRAEEVGRKLYFEGTVMAGTPSIRLAQEALQGCEIKRFRGILNGTTNYILTQMENGMEYADALRRAQELGYAETDPTADVEGWDAAGKVIILTAALFGHSLTFDQMHVQGISQLTQADIQAAREAGERWKLIAEGTPEGGSVQPMRLPLDHPLANVPDAINAIQYTTDLLGDVTLIGAGAGRSQTGFAILSDLFAIHRHMSIL